MTSSKGDLWDDSALVNAFDQAMTKFKSMHVTVNVDRDSSNHFEEAEGKLHVSEDSYANDGSGESGIKRPVVDIDTNQESGDQLSMKAGLEDTENIPTKHDTVKMQESDKYVHASESIPVQDNFHNISRSQGLEDYNVLCKRYYELEGERLQIWQKLQQYGGGWNYSYPEGFPVRYGTSSSSQEPFTSNQASHPTATVSCHPCSCTCPCSAISCSSFTPCSLCGPWSGVSCMDAEALQTSEKQPNTTEPDVVRKGIEAAEKVTSMLKEKLSDFQVEVESCSKKSTTGRTDLTDVLNAWYSAGFYTGKYLTEESLARKQDG